MVRARKGVVSKVMNIKKLLILSIFMVFVTAGCAMNKPGMEPIGDRQPAESHDKESSYLILDSGDAPLSPLGADFNNDGFVDIAVVSHGDSSLSIFYGTAGRKFRKGPVYPKALVGYHPGKIAVVDWNRDGLPDILLACEGIFQVQYWENKGNGFEKAASIKVNLNAKSIAVGDLDQDGRLDIVLGPHQGSRILVLWGKGMFFDFEVQSIKTAPMTENVELADWNGDGMLDIFWVEKRFGAVAVALNQGKRRLKRIYIKEPGRPRGLIKDGPEYVKLADLDGDGCLDASVPLEVGKACLIFYGDCSGGVSRQEKIPAPEWGYSGLAVIGKGAHHPPMVALGEEMRIFVAKKEGDSWILEERPAGSLPRDLTFMDMDKDGNVDLLFANSAGKTIGVLFGPF